MNALSVILILLAATGMAQTGDLVWCPATENYLNHKGTVVGMVAGVESIEACEAACDANENGCDFVWFKSAGKFKGVCRMLAEVHKFKPRLFKSRGMTYSGRLCIQDDPRILPCTGDWHCYKTDYCHQELKTCEPMCNGDTICDPCESCYDVDDETQECRADGNKCPLTEEPTTPEPTEVTEEPTAEPTTKIPTQDPTEEPTTATPTMATAEPTTLDPTAAPTAPVWCPATDKYMNHQGTSLGQEWGLNSIEECEEACDSTEDCNFVWFFAPMGRRKSRCRFFGGAEFLKPRSALDLRPITYSGRLCGVTDATIFCTRPTHCYATDTCNLEKRICEPGIESPMKEMNLRKVDTSQASTSAETRFLQLLFAVLGMVTVVLASCKGILGIIFRKNYDPIPGQDSPISEEL